METNVFNDPSKIESSTNEQLIYIRDNLYKAFIRFDWDEVGSNKDGTMVEQYKFELLKRGILICPKERDKKISEILNGN